HPIHLPARDVPGVRVDGVYTNNLSNGGETVTLVHVTCAPIFSAKYGTRPPWPPSADGTGFNFPSGAEIPENGLLLVVGSDPDAFRGKYAVPAGVPVFGPFPGALQDG